MIHPHQMGAIMPPKRASVLAPDQCQKIKGTRHCDYDRNYTEVEPGVYVADDSFVSPSVISKGVIYTERAIYGGAVLGELVYSW